MNRFAEGLAWLEDRVRLESRRLRARYELSLEELRGLFISDAQVDALLESSGGPSASAPCPADPLGGLVARLGLPDEAESALLLLLAPELDPRFSVLYAYLNDDAARRWATPDLVERLLGRPAAALFAPASPLVRLGVAVAADRTDHSRPLTLRGWRASPALVHRALGLPGQHMPCLRPCEAGFAADPLPLRPPWPVLLVTGRPGSGRAALAAAHAAAAGLPALAFDAAAAGEDRGALLAEAAAAARLDGSMLIVEADGIEPLPCPAELPVAVVATSAGGWPGLLHSSLVLSLRPAEPGSAERAACWRAALRDLGLPAPRAAVQKAADRFRLSPAAIGRAARRAAMSPGDRPLPARLLESARAEAAVDPGALARRIAPTCGWPDLVLPAGALRQLRDFANAIDRRVQVFEDWGFGAVGRATGSGLAALFSGGSGTGKTMSASVIAASAGLDLWKIDLSAMVSKYIGETEKNLERLFTSAEAGDSILFFDEADSIFGKRSEVKDAHDRYSNIETAYLLQRIEQFDGIVILATNISQNIDSAFLRRIPFVIDFPFPGPAARAQLWRKAIPDAAPLAAEVDLSALGDRFEMSGGDIRSAALEAGFLAAGNGGIINAHALELAVSRQLMKRGQLTTLEHPA